MVGQLTQVAERKSATLSRLALAGRSRGRTTSLRSGLTQPRSRVRRTSLPPISTWPPRTSTRSPPRAASADAASTTRAARRAHSRRGAQVPPRR